MKYIRTKCNIFEVIEETDLVYRVVGASRERNNVYSKSKCRTEVIKSADTIEGLCDEFVLVGERLAPKHSFLTFEQAKFNFKSLINQTYVEFAIYGAMWTDKGLIYVAKMNEKGELELL